MNTHPSYTLGARPETGRTLRAWAVLSRGTTYPEMNYYLRHLPQAPPFYPKIYPNFIRSRSSSLADGGLIFSRHEVSCLRLA